MNISGYCAESITEGEGFRGVVYISGCRHKCKGCFNKETWDFKHGEPFTIELQEEVIEDIRRNPLVDGLTLCGGDPFFSAAEVSKFVRRFRSVCPEKTVWAYTGFRYEEILQNPVMFSLLALCDVIVDGRFIIKEKDMTLKFRGSRNQRIIDVQESLKTGKVASLCN